MIAKFVNDKKEAWSDFLDTSVFAYNTSRHTSSQFTPFELMFNRRAAIPIDIELRKEMSEDLATGYIELPEPDPAVVKEKRKKRLEEVKENILQAQKKQKEQYDKKHAKPHLFQPGQLVLKRGKLDLKYLGPYTIVEELGKGTYLLALVGRPEEKVRATGAHLKAYTTPENPPNKLADVSFNDTSSNNSLNPLDSPQTDPTPVLASMPDKKVGVFASTFS